jgi:pyruvate,water dikinase
MQSELVFSIADANDVSLAGGKAHALGRMIGEGLRIPEGFVVSSKAFGVMTPALRTLLLQHFSELQAGFVAVRSSAVNEDGMDAAWAGQLDTFLNTTQETLLHNIQQCWQSAHSTRAQAYAKQKSLTTGPVAVLVQKMVQSDVSGVAFSTHPVLNDGSSMVIEAGLGLGEAIVSGIITPDTYIVNKDSGQIIQKHVANQTTRLVKDVGGNTVWQNTPKSGASQKLSDAHIMELSGIVHKLEVFFGHPVDVEWALHDNTLYVLQSRPITTLM